MARAIRSLITIENMNDFKVTWFENKHDFWEKMYIPNWEASLASGPVLRISPSYHSVQMVRWSWVTFFRIVSRLGFKLGFFSQWLNFYVYSHLTPLYQTLVERKNNKLQEYSILLQMFYSGEVAVQCADTCLKCNDKNGTGNVSLIYLNDQYRQPG